MDRYIFKHEILETQCEAVEYLIRAAGVRGITDAEIETRTELKLSGKDKAMMDLRKRIQSRDKIESKHDSEKEGDRYTYKPFFPGIHHIDALQAFILSTKLGAKVKGADMDVFGLVREDLEDCYVDAKDDLNVLIQRRVVTELRNTQTGKMVIFPFIDCSADTTPFFPDEICALWKKIPDEHRVPMDESGLEQLLQERGYGTRGVGGREVSLVPKQKMPATKKRKADSAPAPLAFGATRGRYTQITNVHLLPPAEAAAVAAAAQLPQ